MSSKKIKVKGSEAPKILNVLVKICEQKTDFKGTIDQKYRKKITILDLTLTVNWNRKSIKSN